MTDRIEADPARILELRKFCECGMYHARRIAIREALEDAIDNINHPDDLKPILRRLVAEVMR